MKFYCAEDIENLAAQGKKELILDESVALTDLARETARQLGIAIVIGSRATPAKAASPVAPTAREAALKLGDKPKGCQHGPLATTARHEHSNGHRDSDGVVDQLVELVRQSASKRSGN